MWDRWNRTGNMTKLMEIWEFIIIFSLSSYMFLNSHNGVSVCVCVSVAYRKCLIKIEAQIFHSPLYQMSSFVGGGEDGGEAKSILWGWQELSKLKRYKGVDGKGNPPVGSDTAYKRKGENGRRDCHCDSLTFPSHCARVKDQVTRKTILVVNHLPYFVYIKKALVLTTFQPHRFPPTLKLYQEVRLTKIPTKWLYYKEHLICKPRDSLLVILNCMICNIKVKHTLYYYRYFR